MSVFEAQETVALSIDEVFALSRRVLTGAGLSVPHAEAVARAITAGERDECASHGLYRLPGCVMTIRSGKLSLDAEPVIEDASPALVRVDARHG